MDEQPVRCDVTLPATCIISRERVITISLFQRRSIRQFFDDSGQEFRVIAPLYSAFEVPLKT